MSTRGPRGFLLAVLLFGIGLTGCGTSRDAHLDRPLVAGSEAFGACPSAGSSRASEGGLPHIKLTCLDRSGSTFELDRIVGKPMVVNLWASWCPPCGKELPAFQRLSVDAAGSLVVLGVITEDSVETAVQSADDIKLTFPQVYDRQGALRRELGRAGLPVTIFVDADGVIAHVYNGAPLREESLNALVKEHLGIDVV